MMKCEQCRQDVADYDDYTADQPALYFCSPHCARGWVLGVSPASWGQPNASVTIGQTPRTSASNSDAQRGQPVIGTHTEPDGQDLWLVLDCTGSKPLCHAKYRVPRTSDLGSLAAEVEQQHRAWHRERGEP